MMQPNEIRAELMRRNIKLNSLAASLGVSSAYVCQVITGVRIGPRIRQGIAHALGYTVEQIWPNKDQSTET